MVLSWAIIAYVVFGVAAAGILGTQGILAAGGRGSEARPAAVVAALACAVLAAVAATLRLGRVDRVFHVFANLSSGISQGYVAVLFLIAAAIVLLVVMRRSEEGAEMPLWCAILAIVVALLGVYGIAANLTATSLNVAKTLLTCAYLLAAALAVGSLASLAHDGYVAPCSALAPVLAGATGVLAIVFFKVAPTLGTHTVQIVKSQYGMVGIHPTAGIDAVQAVSGDAAFWVVSVLVGAVAPLVLALVGRKVEGVGGRAVALLAALCILAGVGVAVAATLFSGQAVQLVAR